MTWIEGLEKFSTLFSERVEQLFAKKTDIPEELPANGGNADTVNNHTVNANVPANANFTDTTYSVMGAATSSAAGKTGLVPAPEAGQQNAFLRGDGTWSEMVEATDEDIAAIVAGTFN